VLGLVLLLTPFVSYRHIVRSIVVLAIASFLLLLGSSLALWRQGYRPARYYSLSWTAFLVSIIVMALARLGLTPSTAMTEQSYLAGTVCTVLLLALALADRISLLQSEAEQANRELQASESRLQQYLEAMPVGVTVRDALGRLRYANQRARQMRHWPDEARGDGQAGESTLEETIQEAPLYVSGTRQAYPLERLPPARALQGESASVDDIEMQVGRQRIPLEIWSSPVLDEQVGVQYAISAFQDISERVQAQARIQDRLAVETALSNISTRLVQATDLDRAISETLAEVGPLLAFDRLFLVRIRPDRAELDMTHEWRAAGVSTLLLELRGVPLADVPWLLGQLRANGIVYVQDASALPPQAVQERRFIEEHLGGRRCALPIWMGPELDGFLACHSHSLTSPVLENEVQVLETVAGMLGSVLQRSRVLETLESRVNDRTRELDTLYRVTTQTSAAQSLEVTLRHALEVVLPALGVPMGAIHLQEDRGSPLHLVTHEGFPTQAIRELASPLPAGRGPEEVWWQQVLAQDRPLLLLRDPCAEPQVLPWACLAEIQAYLGIPIRVAGAPAGVLSVFGESGQAFTAEEMALLATVADQLGVAVESDRLRLRAAEARVVQERQRLARDLHDAVTQSLYSLTLFAEAAREMCQGGQMDRAHQYLVRIGQTAQRALREMRLLIYELRPPDLERGGLVQALEHRLEAVERRAGIEATLMADGSDHGLPLPVEEALYRIAQEALNNALKHAAATHVVMTLTVGHQALELAVRDNGQGFDPGVARQGGGMGLANIRQRASDLGGAATIISTPGEGTEVRVTLPATWVQQPEQEGAT